MSKIAVSPILYVAPFTGGIHFNGHRYNEILAGDPWLTCAEHPNAFCVQGIDPEFKPLAPFVRLYVSLEKLEGYVPYAIDDVPRIGGLADDLMLRLFECDAYGEWFDRALAQHLGLDQEDFDTEEFMPGHLYYKVVPV